MGYWLVKSEPSVYSWQQLQKDKIVTWDGVKNYAARLNIKAMKKNDKVLFYHSNEGMEIVGMAKVVKEAYPDKTTDHEKWLAIDLKPLKQLSRSVQLATLKADSRFANMELVRLGRLSVQKVTDHEWKMIIEMAGKK